MAYPTFTTILPNTLSLDFFFFLTPFPRNHTVVVTVNNVGMQYLYPMYLAEVPESTMWDLINVNVGATTHMTKLVLPDMQKRKRGAIVNVSSSAELQPLPLLAIYAATKVPPTYK